MNLFFTNLFTLCKVQYLHLLEVEFFSKSRNIHVFLYIWFIILIYLIYYFVLTFQVTDFGLSKFVDAGTMMKTFCGTPSYLAPEILLTVGMGAYTKAIDCWSLGVIIYIWYVFSSSRTVWFKGVPIMFKDWTVFFRELHVLSLFLV